MLNWLFVAVIAQFISGSSAVVDKFFLKKTYPNPVGYAFWLGIFALAAVFFVPFTDFHAIPLSTLTLALIAGATFLAGILLFFMVLFRGEAANTVILIGSLSPLFTLFFSLGYLDITLATYQVVGFSLLILGGFLLYFVEKKELRAQIFLLSILSAIFFGVSNTLSKHVFLLEDFATGFVWIKAGEVLAALAMLLIPRWREKIMGNREAVTVTHSLFYLANRGYAALGSIILSYAIFLGSPALVDATYNLKYFFAFLGSWFILRERPRGWNLFVKILIFTIISFGIMWLAVGDHLAATAPDPNRPITWGVNFSQKFSREFGGDWKENYRAILDDLGAKHLRLVAYWDLIESKEGEFRFEDLDYQMQLAADHGAKVILVVGQRVPRWPECHFPEWTDSLSTSERNARLLLYTEAVITRYRTHRALEMWQVENEPFLMFGECPPRQTVLLDTEIALVKALDPAHPILITDSGEFGTWVFAARRGDAFGTTIYRRVNHGTIGQIDYHLPPGFFRLKEILTRIFTNRTEPFIVPELAAEAWLPKQLWETTPEEQFRYFDFAFLQDTVRYAKETQFDIFYFWGAEWWYWLKKTQNHPEFWDYAKQLISGK